MGHRMAGRAVERSQYLLIVLRLDFVATSVRYFSILGSVGFSSALA